MQEIRWEESGASKQIMSAIWNREAFVIVTEGEVARALTDLFGPPKIAITPTQVKLLLAVAALLALTGIVLFALSRGFSVSGKATTPDGTVYEIRFEPKDDA